LPGALFANHDFVTKLEVAFKDFRIGLVIETELYNDALWVTIKQYPHLRLS